MRTFIILALFAVAIYAQEEPCTCDPDGEDICIGESPASCQEGGGSCVADPDPFGDNNPCPDGQEPGVWTVGDCCDASYTEAHTCCEPAEN